MVAVDDGSQGFSGHLAFDTLAQCAPYGAYLVIDELFILKVEGQFLSVQVHVKDTGGTDIVRVDDQCPVQCGHRPGLEGDHGVGPINRPMYYPLCLQHRQWEGGRNVTEFKMAATRSLGSSRRPRSPSNKKGGSSTRSYPLYGLLP